MKSKELQVIHDVYLTEGLAVREIGKTMLSMDVGSTGTRTLRFDKNMRLGQVVAVESNYAKIDLDDDISYLTSKSKSLYDNMEIIIEDITSNKSVEKMFDKIKVVKGGIMRELNAPVIRATSNTGKVEQESTYVNILSNIGIRALMDASNEGKKYNRIIVDLTLSLPTEDTRSRKRLESFRGKLSGEYVVEFPRLNYKVVIEIRDENIFIEDESQAALRYWATYNEQSVENLERVIIIDGGGRSFDFGFLEKGRLNSKGCKTLPFGGNRFETYIKDHYVENNDVTEPTSTMIKEALDTGLLQDGNNVIKISDSIKYAKRKIAGDIMAGLNDLFDGVDVNPRMINLVICTGRCFNITGDRSNGTAVASLYKFIEAAYKKVSPNTDFDRLREEYPIVKGLVFFRLSQE